MTLKVKYADFEIITRRRTVDAAVQTADEIAPLAHDLLAGVFPVAKGVRLLGVTVSGFEAEEAVEAEDQLVLI